MKVAVVGAGIAGLACAVTLEKHGIVADVFEQRKRPGDMTPSINTILQVVHRPVPDPVVDLAERWGIATTPIGLVKKIVMFSPGKVATAGGALGYIYERGHSETSLDCELYGKLSRTRVQFHTMASYRELAWCH